MTQPYILLLATYAIAICPHAIVSSSLNYQQYSPELSHLALVLASAAYAPDCGQCYSNSAGQTKFGQLENITQRTIRYEANQLLTLSGFVARFPARRLTAVAYRGTIGSQQLIIEILSVLIRPPIDSSIGAGRVQAYFASAQTAVWGVLEPAYRALRSAYPDDAVLVTGHSLGAAMAALGAGQIMYDRKLAPPADRLSLYTFGEPRVGDGDFARAFNRLVPNSWRVVHGWDPIAQLPACEKLSNQRCDTRSTRTPYHHGVEVYYPHDKPMRPDLNNYRVCLGEPQGEDWSCSDGKVNVLACLLDMSVCLADHINIFGISASKWWLESRCHGNEGIAKGIARKADIM